MRQVYVRRRSRMTAAQSRFYATLDEYRFVAGNVYEQFASKPGTPLLVEIGFGNGEVLAKFAAAHPNWNCLGVEVYRSGIGSLIGECVRQKLTNVRIAETDALTLLETLPDSAIDLLFVFFPDPWPKKRHHRRRLINEEFVDLASLKLSQNASLFIATDWEDYARSIEELMNDHSRFQGGRIERCDMRVKTRFEQRGERIGLEVWDYRYSLVPTSS